MSETAAAAATLAERRAAKAIGRYAIWLVAALLLTILPLLFKSDFALTLMSQMSIAVVFALSYNLLLGQTGMLSFGHAVYYGLGAYFTVHAINAATAAHIPIPLPFMPMVGGAAALLFAIIFGWVSTKRSGTVFAMISLGLAELVGSSSLILRSFFGGEEGVNTNRTKLPAVFGWTFGPQVQVYYLIAFWCLLSAAAMYALTRTPLGRMCLAVRENPQRVAFVGYNPQMIRFMAFCLAGLFGGIAGSLVAINFELASSELFSATQSGMVLFATYIGGAGYFFGPVLGAVLVTYLQTMLSDITAVWQLYFGILFIAIVMFAPGGLAHLIMMHRPLWRAGTLWRLIPSYALGLIFLLIFLAGLVLAVETVARIATDGILAKKVAILGVSFAMDATSWAIVLGSILVGALGLRLAGSIIAFSWNRALSHAGGLAA